MRESGITTQIDLADTEMIFYDNSWQKSFIIKNLEAYLNLENVVCCGGTWLCPGQLMVEQRWDEIEERILKAQAVIDKYR